MQKLINDVFSIIQKDRDEQKRLFNNGDLYNIFDVLNLKTNEVRTHSAFLASLLNPKGNHGMKDAYLRAFVKNVIKDNSFKFITKKADVYVEYSIGTYNADKTEGGRIDILISSGENAIIIENKIYADDQENQIIRYCNYAERMFKNGKILYLTLFGNQASSYSANELVADEDYFPISYESDILDWLKECASISSKKPVIQNTILQYITLIKELTNQMNSKLNEKEMLKLLCSKDNVLKTAAILDYYYPIKEEIESKYFIPKIKAWAKQKGFEYSEDIAGCWFGIKPVDWEHHWFALWIGQTNYDFGIYRESGRVHKTLILNTFSSGYNEGWPFGWVRCSEIFNSIESLANQKATQFIKDNIESALMELQERRQELTDKHITL